MWWLLWLLIGIVVGAAIVWTIIKRKIDEQTAAIEASYDGRLRHLQAEVGRADQAHEETKVTLHELLADRNAADERAGRLDAELEARLLQTVVAAQAPIAAPALAERPSGAAAPRLSRPPAAAPADPCEGSCGHRARHRSQRAEHAAGLSAGGPAAAAIPPPHPAGPFAARQGTHQAARCAPHLRPAQGACRTR